MENVSLKPSERFALGQWLSKYPDDMSYNDIIEHIAGVDDWIKNFGTRSISLESDNPNILVWGALMGCSQERIVEIIENTKTTFEDIVEKYYTPKDIA